MKPEIFLMLQMGFTPQKIAEKTGYKMPLIYYYNRKYKEAQKKVKELI